jgi:hypothetical protein
MIWDYPTRFLNGDHNSGFTWQLPVSGRMEAAAALGHTERCGGSRTELRRRTVSYREFEPVLTPEASRIRLSGPSGGGSANWAHAPDAGTVGIFPSGTPRSPRRSS